MPTSPSNIKALFFDVFGTLVDWRGGIARETRAALEPLGHAIDWSGFADAWRGQYQPAMEEVRSGRIPYAKLDVLHRLTLRNILPGFGLEGLAETVLDRLTLGWHRLDAWPDVSSGLARLRQRYRIAPVSNGNIAIMCDLARRNEFHWDAILGADIARDFKPSSAVYLAAAQAFGLEPEECMMCAAHGDDLIAASRNGLRTAFIARPQEYPGCERAPDIRVDVDSHSTLDLAAKLGA